MYSAGKAFTEYFSQVVSIENPDMDILTVMAGQVKSNKYPYGFDAHELVDGVFHDLGHTNTSYGHWFTRYVF